MAANPDVSFATRVTNKLFPKRTARNRAIQEAGRKYAKEQYTKDITALNAENAKQFR